MKTNKFNLGDIVMLKDSFSPEKLSEIKRAMKIDEDKFPVFVVIGRPGDKQFDLTIKSFIDNNPIYKTFPEEVIKRSLTHNLMLITNHKTTIGDESWFEELDPMKGLDLLSHRIDGETQEFTEKSKEVVEKLKNLKTWPKGKSKKPTKHTVSFQEVEDSIRRSTSTPPKKDDSSNSDEKKN